jgi:hypothetical protein
VAYIFKADKKTLCLLLIDGTKKPTMVTLQRRGVRDLATGLFLNNFFANHLTRLLCRMADIADIAHFSFFWCGWR